MSDSEKSGYFLLWLRSDKSIAVMTLNQKFGVKQLIDFYQNFETPNHKILIENHKILKLHNNGIINRTILLEHAETHGLIRKPYFHFGQNLEFQN